MGLSRRNFIQTGAVAAIAAGIPLSAAARNSNSSLGSIAGTLLNLEGTPWLNMATFKAHVNTVFALRNQKGETSNVTLKSVYDWRAAGNRGSKECFSLMFSGSGTLRQDTYSVTHPSLGSFSMLLAPSGPNKGGQKYEAVFNRLK
jgi:hypothetical protein